MAFYAMWVGGAAALPSDFPQSSVQHFWDPYFATSVSFFDGVGRNTTPATGNVVVALPTPVITPGGRTKLAKVFYLYSTVNTQTGSPSGKILWVTILDGPNVLARIEAPPHGDFTRDLSRQNTYEFKSPPYVNRAISLLITIEGGSVFSGFGADFMAG